MNQRTQRSFVKALGLCSLLALSGSAKATTELPFRYNARSLAMGGTGVAYVDDASAIAMNPAGLDRIESWSATAAMTPFMPRSTAPFAPGVRHSTDQQVIPLFFAGGAVRVLDRLSTGAAVYVASGFGGNYENVPEYGGLDMNLELAVFELAVPVTYRITDQLAIGAALRAGYTFLKSDMPVNIGGPIPIMRLEQNITGLAFPGVLAGVRYQPTEDLGFGLTYRSKLTFDLEGDGTATNPLFGGAQPISVKAEGFATPHSFRLGTAWAAVPQRLLFALDVSYTLFEDSNDEIPVTIDFKQLANTRLNQKIVFHWENSLAALFGAEYMVTDEVAARAGYHIAKMATPESNADPLYPPPGLIHTIHLGGGLRFTHTRFDVGGAYAIGGADVDNSVNTPPGRFSGGYVLVGGSFTYLH